MRSLYKLSQNQQTYSYNVTVSIYGINADTQNSKVNVKYSIEIEYASWGIKGIHIIPTGQIQIPVIFYQDDTGIENNQEHIITVDCTQLKVSWTPGRAVVASELAIYLINVNGQVDYNKSYLECFSIAS